MRAKLGFELAGGAGADQDADVMEGAAEACGWGARKPGPMAEPSAASARRDGCLLACFYACGERAIASSGVFASLPTQARGESG